MEDSYSSPSHSHSHSHSKAFSSKKAYNNNADGFNACDDVFGGPPNFGVTAFAPRAEDYTEIFGNFRSSRASSIPILDLPPVDDAVVSFDVWSSNFDYAEVFSGFHAVDFATPFDELFKHSEGHGGDSSEDAWNAAGIESPSEESDLSTCLRKNHCFYNEAIPQSFDSKQFNVSYHRVDLGAREGKPDIIHVAQLNALPGYSYVVDEAASLERIEKDKLYSLATDEIIFSEDSSGNISEEQYVRKIFSNPSHSGMRISSFSRDHRPGGAHDTGGAPPNPPFISISDICLRTQPSHLPPPSRPPPVLAERKRDSNRMTSDARAPRTSISEITFDESLPHFFDVDASSSAAASAAAMEKAMEEAQEKLRTVKEMMVKKDSPQRLTKPGLQNSVNGEEKVRMIIDDECPVKDARQQAKQGEHEDGKCSGKGTQGAQKDAPSLPGLYEQSAHVSVKPSQRKHREHSFSGDLVLTEEAGEWKESMPYYEFINNDNSSSATQLENYEEYLLQGTNAYKPGNDNGKAVAFEEQEDSGERIKAAKKTHEWGKNAVSMNSVKRAYEPEENRWKLKATKASSRQEYHEKMVKVAQSVHDRVVHKHVQNEKSLNEASEGNRNEKKLVIDNQLEENNRRVDQAPQQADSDKNEKHSLVQEEKDRRLREALEREEFKNKVNEACKGEDNERRSKEALEGEENEKRVKKTSEREEIEINLGIAVRQEYKKKSEKMFVLEENEKRCKEATKEEGGKRIKEACVREGYVVKEAWDRARTERNLEEAVDLQQSDKILKEAAEVDKCKKHDDMGEEKNRKRPDENLGPVANDKKVEELQKRDEDEKKFKRNLGLAEFLERSMLPCEREETGRAHAVIHEKEEQYRVCKDGLPILLEGMDEDSACYSEIGLNLPADVLKSSNEACSLEEKSVQLADRACKLEKPQGKAYAVQGEPVDVGIGKIGTEHGEEELNAVKMEDVLADERRTESILVQDSARNNSQEEDGMVEASESTHIDEKTTNLDRLCIGDGLAPEEEKEQVSNQCFVKEFNHEQGGRLKTLKEDEVLLEQVKETDRSAATQAVNGFTEHVRQTEPSQPVMLDRKESIQKRSQMPNINQTTERKAKIINDCFISKERDKEERLKGEREVEGERLRQLEEEREREREKDRIAVVTLEGHERAAVERATAEARQRVMAEARERLERACAEVREKSEKASTEARLRAEHAAVERATAEAREHAIEKAVIERVNFEARERLDRSISDKFSSSSREMGMGRSCSFSITEKLDGGGGESAQRCRARLERHCRTVERVAKALAEKNMRDLLAQREQAERNRLAETLDADIKRWSNGKEGNLRALLSTLQYVLGPDSGWQPIPLTDVITAAAVKKAYRKATLCVHPDKLQQRGASIQQKYICEKVFDLLKDAWSKFNSEEH